MTIAKGNTMPLSTERLADALNYAQHTEVKAERILATLVRDSLEPYIREIYDTTRELWRVDGEDHTVADIVKAKGWERDALVTAAIRDALDQLTAYGILWRGSKGDENSVHAYRPAYVGV